MTHKGKPETVAIAIARPDGGVSIMHFVTEQKRNGDDPGWRREASAENINAEIAKAGIPSTGWRIIDPSEIPQDRKHRNAWKDDNGRLAIDPDKAAAIDEARKLDQAVKAALKAQHDALVESVRATLK
jgi:hypothetical protein